jgi:hypothetical protein
MVDINQVLPRELGYGSNFRLKERADQSKDISEWKTHPVDEQGNIGFLFLVDRSPALMHIQAR